MNLTSLQNTPTMSSREIAELCDKEHRNVCRDIENLNATYGQMGMLKIEQTPYTHEQNGQTYYEYQLTKEQTIDLITGYRADLRIKINRRWQQLEQATAPRLPTTYLEALEALLASEKAKLTLEQQASINAPKVAHYDRVVARTNLVNATHVASKLKLSAVKLNRHLCELGVYNQAVKRGKVFNTWFIDKGYGQMKQTELGYDQALFTHAGEMWVIEMMISEGVVG